VRCDSRESSLRTTAPRGVTSRRDFEHFGKQRAADWVAQVVPHEPGAVTRDLRVGFLGKAETGRPAIFFSKMPSAATSL
jgi:hypothetical protein